MMHWDRSTRGWHIPALDGVRGLAVVLVFFFHASAGHHAPWWPVRLYAAITGSGWVGVPLFFVLSGFLITVVLWNGRGTAGQLRKFSLRRAGRILPLYYASLGITLCAAAVTGELGHVIGHLWSFLLFAQDIPGAPAACMQQMGPLPVFHLWSLAVEEQFYLLWPLLLSRQRGLPQARRLCGIIMIASTSLRVAALFLPALANVLPLVVTRSAELALGAYVALAWRDGSLERLQQRAAPLAIGSITVFCLSSALGGKTAAALTIPSASAGFAALLTLTLTNGRTARMLAWGPLRKVGKLSYGIYLFHVLLAPLYDRMLLRAGLSHGMGFHVSRVVLCAAGSYAIAELAYRFIEQPAMRLADTLCRGTAARPTRQPLTYSPSFFTSSL